ncbi:MAG: HAMP domain-containing protein [Comamonadaceae bacterium]|nr:MAG: HAMP domain-containing protein [Comamonadaceae bacterium]
MKRIVIARKNLLSQGILIAIAELLLSAGLLTLLGLLITRQLSLLTTASLTVAQGQLTPAPVPEGLDDVGRLGAAFNVMSRAIAERVEQLISANEQTARMAASLQDRTEQLNAIFDLSPDGFVSFDAQSHVKYANPAFFRMTGLDSAGIIGLDEAIFSARLAKGCLDPSAFPNLAELKSELGASHPPGIGESSLPAMKRRRQLIELAGPGNHVLELGLRLSTAETVSQILYFREVTHETEVDRMKSEFLSHAAHELRTPMASIYGYAEIMMAQSFSKEEQSEFLAIIHRQCGLMISIINELLDLARIDDRRGKDFKFSSIDASQLVREVIADFGVPSGQQALVLDTPAQACWVRADASKLMQAVRNILSNAYKYSPDGGVVAISVIHAGSDSQTPVGIRVTDHGLGMTSEQAARTCERFYRVDTSGNIPGTGLGMSIVKEIMELHGGQVQIQSQLGAGTSVTLWLTPASAPV